GATFAAILVVPLGVAIMNQTALSPLDKVFDRWRGPESGAVQQPAEPRLSDNVMAESMPMPTGVPYTTSRQVDMGMILSQGQPGDRFADFDEARVQIVAENPVSTFSI